MSEQAQDDSGWLRFRRHPAVQAAAVYAGASWAIIEGADIFFPSFGLSQDAIRWLGLVLALGFVGVVGFVLWSTSEHRGARSQEPEGSPGSASAKRRRRWAYAAALALLIVGGVFWWARPRLLGAVSPAAEVIAIMPFHTSGRDVELLGEGMVDLLSPNLDAVGEIRTVDARTVLHHWRQRAQDGSLDLDGALQVGRDVDAGSILWGTAISAGPEVRLTAELYTVKGNRLASASADGPADSVLALVDSLSIKLLRDIWVARDPLPSLRVSGITTGSVDAIRAYLVGEQYYRRSRWDSAVHAFRTALEADSTFALAHFRLANSYGWQHGHGSSLAVQHGQAALRFSERLPARERTLLAAHDMFEAGETAAHDTLLKYTGRYPDDAEAWYQLGDVRYHARPLLGFDLDELYSPFERVLELDPSLAPAFIHPVELSLSYHDSARYVRWRDALVAASPPEQAEPYVLAGEVAFGPGEQVEEQTQRLGELKPTLLSMIQGGRFHSTQTDWDRYLAGLRQAAENSSGPSTFQANLIFALAATNTALGRLEEAKPWYDSLWTLAPTSQGWSVMAPVLAGLVDSSYAEGPLRYMREPHPEPQLERLLGYLRIIYALSRGREQEARRQADEVISSELGDPYPTLIEASLGWADVLAGDTLAGLARLESSLLEAGFRAQALSAGSPLRMLLASLQAERPETREEGINRLFYGLFFSDFPYLGQNFLLAGQALEEAGDSVGAIRAYSLFVHHWERADPHLQPKVATARQALERLAGEGPP